MSNDLVVQKTLSKAVYELGAAMRRLQMCLQNGAFSDHRVSRDQIQKMTESARDLAAWLHGHHER